MKKTLFVLAAFGLLSYMIIREVDSASSASIASGHDSAAGSATSAQATSDAKRALASVKSGAGSGLSANANSPNGGSNGSAGSSNILSGSNNTSAGLNTGNAKSPNLTQIRETALAQLQKKAPQAFEVRRDNFSDDVRTLQDGSMGNIIPPAFIAEYSENLFGVPASHLVETHRETTDRTKVVYTQQVEGIDVYGGTLTLFYEGSSLTRVQNDLVANETRAAMPTAVSTSEMLAFLEQSARRSAQVRREESLPTLQLASSQQAKMIYYPSSTGLVHAYQIPVQEIRKNAKPVAYMAIVDAEHLRIIAKKPLNYE